MARKPNRFSGIDLTSFDAAPVPERLSGAGVPPMSQHGPLAAVRSTLAEARQNSVLELDPATITDGGVADRMDGGQEDLQSLTDSIRSYGQHVPIMVRPARRGVDRYEVIAGRRRLLATRALGIPVKAIVRDVDERELLILQGQENAHRLDLSFIEKANFAAILQARGYANQVIAEAINTHLTTISSMLGTIEKVTQPLVEAIGAAHGAGRRKWLELADRVAGDTDLAGRLAAALAGAELHGEARLDHVLALVKRPPEILPPAPDAAEARQRNRLTVRTAEGGLIARIDTSKRKVQISVEAKDQPDFADWLGRNARQLMADLYLRWRDEPSGDGADPTPATPKEAHSG